MTGETGGPEASGRGASPVMRALSGVLGVVIVALLVGALGWAVLSMLGGPRGASVPASASPTPTWVAPVEPRCACTAPPSSPSQG